MTKDDKPNVILLISDTLRPDFLSCYGGNVSTPAIDALAKRGTLFEQAYAPGPGTTISHASMFSGKHPSETGVVGTTSIPGDTDLIAEWLGEKGYETYGIAGPSKMGSEFGLARGFDDFFETYTDDLPDYQSPSSFLSGLIKDPDRKIYLKEFYRTARKGFDNYTYLKFNLLKKQLKEKMGSPFFAMVNTTIVHTPYDPPRPYKEEATPELNRPKWFLLEHILGREETLERDDVRPERIYNAQTTDGIARYLADPDYLTDEEMEVLKDWYKACIRYLDDQIDNLLTWLEDEGLIDDTICDLTGTQAPKETNGISLFGEDRREAVYSEYGIRHRRREGHRKQMDEEQLHEFAVGQKCVRTEDYLYVYRSDGEERLYERPGEESIQNPDSGVMEDLRDRLFEELDPEFRPLNDDEDVDKDMSEEVKTNLRELGYID